MNLFPTLLNGRRVRLEPLSMQHVDGLAAAAAESREHYGLTWSLAPCARLAACVS